jgi:hypothetical protein
VRAVALDWSGAADPLIQRRRIWVAEAEDGRLLSLSAGRTRVEAVDHLLGILEWGEATVAGLDFAFGFPEWWTRAAGATDGPTLWGVAAESGEAWLGACAPPFWGRPGRPRPPVGPDQEWRRTERQIPAGARRPKSVFQIGGAGAVGTGSIRGMPQLSRLHDAGVAVWPFDDWPASGPVVAEVYPRWCTGPVNKSDPAQRAAHLARSWPGLHRAHREAATASDDAFDAACSALVLSLARPPTVGLDAIDRIEGRVLPIDPGLIGPSGGVRGGAAAGQRSGVATTGRVRSAHVAAQDGEQNQAGAPSPPAPATAKAASSISPHTGSVTGWSPGGRADRRTSSTGSTNPGMAIS